MLNYNNIPKALEAKFRDLALKELDAIILQCEEIQKKYRELKKQREELEMFISNGEIPLKIDIKTAGLGIVKYLLTHFNRAISRYDIKQHLYSSFNDEEAYTLNNRASVALTGEKNKPDSTIKKVDIGGNEYFAYEDWFDEGDLKDQYKPEIAKATTFMVM